MNIKQKLTSIYYSIYRYIVNDLKFIHKDIYKGISNLISYFYIIWCDRNWDHFFIYRLLIFKLKRVSKTLKKYNRYIGVERDCEKINLVVNLLQKDIDEYYSLEYQDYYKSEFIFEKIVNSKNTILKTKEIENNLKEYFKKYPRLYNKYKNCSKDDVHIALQIGNNLQTKCHNLAFELIKRNINKWWD